MTTSKQKSTKKTITQAYIQTLEYSVEYSQRRIQNLNKQIEELQEKLFQKSLLGKFEKAIINIFKHLRVIIK